MLVVASFIPTCIDIPDPPILLTGAIPFPAVPQGKELDQQHQQDDAFRLHQCIADRYGEFGTWMECLSYFSAFSATSAVVLNEVAEDREERGMRQADQFLNSPRYRDGKRTRNLVKAMKGAGAATGVVGAFASGFNAGMLVQCNYME
jgi:hypothetical protein